MLLALTGFAEYSLEVFTEEFDFSCLKQQTVQTSPGMMEAQCWASSTGLCRHKAHASPGGQHLPRFSCLHVLVEHNTLTPTERCFYKTSPETARVCARVWCCRAAGTLSRHGAWGQTPRNPRNTTPSLHQRAYP